MQALTRQQMVVVLSAATAVLFAFLLLVRSCTGGGLGEPCGRTGGCKLGLTCVAAKCLPSCNQDRDCPTGMRCGIMQLPGTEFIDAAAPILVCLPREDAERQMQQAVDPGGNRLTALNQKRSETYDAVQQLLDAENWTLSDDAFEEAWARLPEAVRREREPAALARLIMTTAGTPGGP